MKRLEQDRLLSEILTGDELTDFRQASLERTLISMKRQRRRQRAVRAGALAALPFLVAVGIILSRSRGNSSRQIASSNSAQTVVVSTLAGLSPVKFITDDELLALFPDRPVALIGKPGRQQLVFFDELDKDDDGGL